MKVSIPHSVWWITMISRVPSLRWEIASERMTSSVTTPPALRMMCASPFLRPSRAKMSMRESMQVTTATCLAGGVGRPPVSNSAAYAALLRRKSSVALIRGEPRLLGHMPELIEGPSRVEAAGTKPKLIDEYAGRVNTGESRVSVAHMRSPAGWVEPGQRPEFDEYTLVLNGGIEVEHEGGSLSVRRRPGGADAGRRVGALLDARGRRVRRRLPARLLAGHRPSRRIVKRGAIGVVLHPRRDSADMVECIVRWAEGHGKDGADAGGGARPGAARR